MTSASNLRSQKKEEKIKPKVRNKGVKKIIAEISEVGNRKTINSVHQKSFFCVKMIKIDKLKSYIIKEKKKEHPTTNIKMKELPWQSSGQGSMLPMQGAWV